MLSAATSGRHASRYATRLATGTPIVPVEKLMIARSPTSSVIASLIAWKSSIS